MRKCLVGILFCLLIFSANLFSQIVLEGTVSTPGMDPEPVENALVELIDQADTTRVLSSTTDDKGHYSIQITQTGIGDAAVQKPGAFNLNQNYPNPFNPTTVISYELPHPADVRIEIYNVLGQRIKTLFDGFQSNLYGRVIWYGTNDLGQGVSTGVYIYSLAAEGIRINKKMLLIDGHTGENNISGSTMPNITGPGQLNKTMSTNYYLRVSGDSLSTVQDTLVVTDNMTHDVSIYRTITDIEGNVYKIVKIGDQWWMAENLKVTHYRNGDPIPNVTDSTDWVTLKSGAFCNYNNIENYVSTYGRLYNWFAVNDNNFIAPEGWHVPSDEEWRVLINYLGGSEVAGGKIKESGTSHWFEPNTGATNESDFSALPGGYRFIYDSDYYLIFSNAYFWFSTEIYDNYAWYCVIYYNNANINSNFDDKHYGMSIRCVRD
ncbi:T9SS type A sorting domain-containing protein [candidate division KSB1 bacterium]|nr:T9SS type A sorting domain-containing protein [candidate division KSB1 bacterium]